MRPEELNVIRHTSFMPARQGNHSIAAYEIAVKQLPKKIIFLVVILRKVNNMEWNPLQKHGRNKRKCVYQRLGFAAKRRIRLPAYHNAGSGDQCSKLLLCLM